MANCCDISHCFVYSLGCTVCGNEFWNSEEQRCILKFVLRMEIKALSIHNNKIKDQSSEKLMQGFPGIFKGQYLSVSKKRQQRNIVKCLKFRTNEQTAIQRCYDVAWQHISTYQRNLVFKCLEHTQYSHNFSHKIFISVFPTKKSTRRKMKCCSHEEIKMVHDWHIVKPNLAFYTKIQP